MKASENGAVVGVVVKVGENGAAVTEDNFPNS